MQYDHHHHRHRQEDVVLMRINLFSSLLQFSSFLSWSPHNTWSELFPKWLFFVYNSLIINHTLLRKPHMMIILKVWRGLFKYTFSGDDVWCRKGQNDDDENWRDDISSTQWGLKWGSSGIRRLFISSDVERWEMMIIVLLENDDHRIIRDSSFVMHHDDHDDD